MPYKNFLWGGGIGGFFTAEFDVENCLGLQRYRLLNILENKFRSYCLIEGNCYYESSKNMYNIKYYGSNDFIFFNW